MEVRSQSQLLYFASSFAKCSVFSCFVKTSQDILLNIAWNDAKRAENFVKQTLVSLVSLFREKGFMLLLWWCPFKIQKEKWASFQFTSTDYLSLVLIPLRIRWTITLSSVNILKKCSISITVEEKNLLMAVWFSASLGHTQLYFNLSWAQYSLFSCSLKGVVLLCTFYAAPLRGCSFCYEVVLWLCNKLE